jgi:hypothetical protein
MKKTVVPLVLALLALIVCGVLAGCGRGAKQSVNVQVQIDALKGTQKDPKIDACIELAKLKEGAVAAVPALIECLKDSDFEIRRMSAYALGEIGPPAIKALPALKDMIQDQNRDVVFQVVASMRAIDPKSVPKGLQLRKAPE